MAYSDKRPRMTPTGSSGCAYEGMVGSPTYTTYTRSVGYEYVLYEKTYHSVRGL